MRVLLGVTAAVFATSALAAEVVPVGGGQYEIVQEIGFSYSQDQRQGDAARFCKKRGRIMQVIADDNSLRFACVRRG
jgi:hypothetical protein